MSGQGQFLDLHREWQGSMADGKTPEQPFDCEKCADGDALRYGESCAYCGLVNCEAT
jgi:hypothetical protein